MRYLLSIAMLIAAWLPSLGANAQQESVQLCLPDAATRAMRDSLTVELRARGHHVHSDCQATGETEAQWVLSLEAAHPLADVWVRAVRSDGTERQARAGGPLDTLDDRALALTAASLLEAEPAIPELTPQPAPPSYELLSETAPTSASAEPSAAEPSAAAPPPATPEPVELVLSTRTLEPVFMLEFGVMTGLVSEEHGYFGTRFGLAFHLSPWLRLRIPLAFALAPNPDIDSSGGLGFDFLISLVRGESWLELGISAKYGTQIDFRGIGPSVNVAFFYALSHSWRVFVRGEATMLFDLQEQSDPHYSIALSAGFAVFL